jgi:hypothetical protein
MGMMHKDACRLNSTWQARWPYMCDSVSSGVAGSMPCMCCQAWLSCMAACFSATVLIHSTLFVQPSIRTTPWLVG